MPRGTPNKWGGSLKTRFDAKWALDTETGCWLWSAATDGCGYGTFFWKDHSRKAHRCAWMIYRGSIPRGKVIDHLCRVRRCVNPDHLRIVGVRTNATKNSDSPSAVAARRTQCSRCGGPYSKAPTYLQRTGLRRICVPCLRERTYRRNRAFRIRHGYPNIDSRTRRVIT